MTQVVVLDPRPRGEGVIPQGQPKGKGYLPRELRVKLFNEVVGLRRRGLTYREIIGWVEKNHGVRLSKSSVSEWLHGVHSPFNGRYIPSIDLLRPSEELAYVIGVKLGDGYTTKKRRTIRSYNHVRIGLEVKDREFADEFARCLAKVLGRSPKKPRYRKSRKRYVVEVKSQTLYELLKKPVDLDRLKTFIEHSEDCVAAFLRGFTDSESCVNERGYISIYNTDLRLLEYVGALLQRLGVAATGPRPKTRRGKVFHDQVTGKRYKDCYYLHIRASSNTTFYRKVGFTIQRKRRRLENYIKRRQAKPLPLSFPLLLNKLVKS